MSNHSSEPDPQMSDFLKQLTEKVDYQREQYSEMGLPLGETGRFPRGKLTESDEGEARIGIANDGKVVIVDFGKPMKWIAFPAAQARDLGETLIRHAEQIEAKLAVERKKT